MSRFSLEKMGFQQSRRNAIYLHMVFETKSPSVLGYLGTGWIGLYRGRRDIPFGAIFSHPYSKRPLVASSIKHFLKEGQGNQVLFSMLQIETKQDLLGLLISRFAWFTCG